MNWVATAHALIKEWGLPESRGKAETMEGVSYYAEVRGTEMEPIIRVNFASDEWSGYAFVGVADCVNHKPFWKLYVDHRDYDHDLRISSAGNMIYAMVALVKYKP